MPTRYLARAALALVTAVILGCVTPPRMDTPKGFAAYDERDRYHAVSPEGVAVAVRVVENDPPQTLAFWVEALRTQLEKTGYTLAREDRLKTRAGEAVLLEWAAPVGEDDWIYLTAIAVVDKRIAVCEAAGPYELYQKHRQAILDSLGSLEVR